jgi:hypothetical protein
VHKQGDSIKGIARTLGISKNTVYSYLIKLATGKLPVAQLLAREDPVLESKFHAGNPAYKDPGFEYLSDNLESYQKQLGHLCIYQSIAGHLYISVIPGQAYRLKVGQLNKRYFTTKKTVEYGRPPKRYVRYQSYHSIKSP